MEDLEKEFEKRKPWITQFTVNGLKFGGDLSLDNDSRIPFFYNCFPGVHTVLDLGSLEGGQTFQLAKYPETNILGLEGREYNVEKANFVKKILNVQNVKFSCVNLETTALKDFGHFDAVFCSGLLYHLPRPWELISGISEVSSKVFIWTHFAKEESTNESNHGFKGCWKDEFGFNDPLSGLSKKSFWVTLPSLEEMLKSSGFVNVRIYENNPNHIHGPSVMLGAWK